MSQGSGILSALAFSKIEGVFTAPVMGALSRETEYLANSKGPTALPTIEDLMRLYYSGFFVGNNGRRNFDAFAIQHGVDFSSTRRLTASGRERQALWGGILNLHRPEYPISLLRQRWRLGVQSNDASKDQLEEYLRLALGKLGFSDRDKQDWYINEVEPLPLAIITMLWRLGLLQDEQDFRSRCLVLGIPDGDAAWYSRLRYTQPTPELLQACIDKHVWDREFVSFWGMDSGQSSKWAAWMRRLGFDYTSEPAPSFGDPCTTSNDPNAQGEQQGNQCIPWTEAIWRSHWRLPSLGELARYRHIFRGDPADNTTWSVPNVKPITWQDMQKFMDANNVPPLMRQMTEMSFYETVSIRHISKFIAMHATTPAEVTGWILDSGVRPDIAPRIAAVMFQEQAEKDAAPILKQRERALAKLQSEIEAAYEIGTLDAVSATAELTSNGVDSAAAVTTLAAIDIAVANRLTSQVIARARADVMSGIVNVNMVGSRLIQAGLAPTRVAQLVATWTAQLTPRRQTLGTSQILSYLRKGLITRDNALVRLANLGWSGADQLLLLHDVQAQIASDAAKAIQTAEADRDKEERAIEQQISKMGSMANQLLSRLKTLTPVAKILKWYKAGYWSEDRARNRLLLLQYTPDVIDTMLLEALSTSKAPAKKKGGA